jgi:membrane protein
VTFGAAVSVGGWIAMSLIFAWYVRDVADYTSLFGNLATLIVVLEYLYLSAIVFLTGVILDARTRQRAEHNDVSPAARRRTEQTDGQPLGRLG